MANTYGPAPGTDREYLIQIYATLRELQGSIRDVFNIVDRHGERIILLENWRANVNGRLALTVGVGGAVVGAVASQIARLIGGP